MSQSFPTITADERLRDSRQQLLDRDAAASSLFSGTEFPSGAEVGWPFYDTNDQKLYLCTASSPDVVWDLIADVSGTPLTQEQATVLFSLAAHNHDTRYSRTDHLHDGRYAYIDHSHVADTALLRAVVNFIYPVGAVVFFTGEGGVNPATRWGVGSWVLWSQGRVVCGAGAATDDLGFTTGCNDSQPFGRWRHNIGLSQMPYHQHVLPSHIHGGIPNGVLTAGFGVESGNDMGQEMVKDWPTGWSGDLLTTWSGGYDPLYLMQPSLGCWIWKRVS